MTSEPLADAWMHAGMQGRKHEHACERTLSSGSLLTLALPAPGHPPRTSHPRAGTVPVSWEATLRPPDSRNSVNVRKSEIGV